VPNSHAGVQETSIQLLIRVGCQIAMQGHRRPVFNCWLGRGAKWPCRGTGDQYSTVD